MKYFYDDIVDVLMAQKFGVQFAIGHIGIREYAAGLNANSVVKYYARDESNWLFKPQPGDWVEYHYAEQVFIGMMRGIDDNGWHVMESGKYMQFVKPENVIGVVKRENQAFPQPHKEI